MALLTLLLAPLVGAATVELQLDTDTYHTPSSPSLLAGVNTVLGPIINLTYEDTAVNAAAKAIGAGLMRYPGGTVADYWSIQDGQYVPGCVASPCKGFADGISKLPSKTFVLEKFYNGVASAAQHTDPPIVDLNVYNLSHADMLEQVDYLADLGVPVPRFELGNEFYITKNYGITAAQYVETIRPVIGRIREKFPDSKIAIVSKKDYDSDWNRNLSIAAASLDYDAVTVHDYSADYHASLTKPSAEAYFMANGAIMMAYFINVTDHYYGPDKPIWNTEYNVLIQQQSITPGSLLACFQVSRVIAAARHKGRYDTLNMHAFGSQDGVGWDGNSGIVRLGAQPNDMDAVEMGPVAAVFAHTASFTLGWEMWVPTLDNNPRLGWLPLTKIPIQPECVQPLVFTKDETISLPMRLLVANVCPQALNLSLGTGLTGLTDTGINATTTMYPADRTATTPWVPLTQFAPTQFPWPSYPSASVKEDVFRSSVDVVLALQPTTVHYIEMLSL